MASRARKYCQAFPCRNLAEPRSSYCQEHRPKPLAKLADAFYLSTSWRRFRDWYIHNHPLCSECERQGRITPATIVDHILELKDGGAPYAEDNVQSLCQGCHNRKTKQEVKRRGEKKVYIYKSSQMLGK